MATLVPALAQGKANLEQYLPILKTIITNWKDIQKAIDDAMKPDVFEQAATVVDNAFKGMAQSVQGAISAGLAVLESGGTYAQAVQAFNTTFGNGIEQSFKTAIFNAIVQTQVIAPLLASFGPAFQYVVAVGLQLGFDNPGVRAAMASLFNQAKEAAKQLGLAIFDAQVDSSQILTPIQRALNDAAPIVVKWATGMQSAIEGALNAAFDVIDRGGSIGEATDAWTTSLGDKTGKSVIRAIVLAMIQAEAIRPFIEKHSAEMQYITAAALEHGVDDPRVQAALRQQFGPDSAFQHELQNLGPFAITLYATILGPDGKPLDPNANKTPADTPHSARGGSFASGMSWVGEEGMELVVANPDGPGFTVIPMNKIAHAAGGVTIGPGGGGGGDGRHDPYIPIGVGPGTGPFGRPKIPPYAPPPPDPGDGSGDSGGPHAKKIAISFSFDKAVNDFLHGGSIKDFEKGLQTAAGEGILKGMEESLLKQAGLEQAMKRISKVMRDAMKDGVIDPAELRKIESMGKRAADNVQAAAETMGPAFEQIAKVFGIDLGQATTTALDPEQMSLAIAGLGESFKVVTDGVAVDLQTALTAAAQAAAPVVGEMVGGSLKGLLSNPANLNFESFSQSLRNAIYQNVAGGLIDAFIQSAVIQGALAPMMGAISLIFDQIAHKQLGVAEANGLIAQQITLIMGVLDDPAFKAAMEALITGIGDIGKNLDAFPAAAATTADAAGTVSDAVTNAQNDVCSGKCQLEKQVIDYGATALNDAGRIGDITDIVYGPHSSGGSDTTGWRRDNRLHAFADGGIVTRPMIGLIGESGPEAVIPLGSAGGDDLVAEVKELRADLGKFMQAVQDQDISVTANVGDVQFVNLVAKAFRVAKSAGIQIGG
jgi:hypothetical protein